MANSILFLDDDVKFRHLMVPGLVNLRFQVVEAGSAEEADHELTLQTFDLIIVDGELPGASGIEWIEKLRRLGNETPIVFLSGQVKDTGSFCDLMNKHRVAVVLHKPIAAAVLARQISEVLRDKTVPCLVAEVADFDAFSESLVEIVREYAESLPSEMVHLAATLRSVKMQADDDEIMKLAIRECHRLSGTAGSYGFKQVGDAVRIIESTLQDLDNYSTLRWQPDVWRTIDDALNQAIVGVGAPRLSRPVPELVASSSGLQWSDRSILFLDDDRSFAKRMEVLLTNEMVMVYSFTDLRRIYTAIEQLNPDLVILDLDMPELDGIEICKHLRSEERWTHLPIVFLTGRQDEFSRLRANSAGCTEYITKPVQDDELLRVVRKFLEATTVTSEQVFASAINY